MPPSATSLHDEPPRDSDADRRFAAGDEWRWLWHQLRPFFRYEVASLVLVLLASGASLTSPLLMKWLIDHILPRRSWGELIAVTVLFFTVTVAAQAFKSGASLVAAGGVLRCAFQIRRRLLARLAALPPAFYADHPVGDLMQRAESDVSVVADLGSDLLPAVVNMVVQSVMTIAIMLTLDWHLTLVALPVAPVFEWNRLRYKKRLRQNSREVRDAYGIQSNLLNEFLTGVTQIQLLGSEHRMLRSHSRLSLRAQRLRWRQRKNEVLFSLTTVTIIALGSAAILGYGGARVMNGQLTAGSLVAFYSYVTSIFAPLSIATDLYARLNRVRASLERLMEIHRTPNTIRDADHAAPLTERGTLIVCTGVDFKYAADKPALIGAEFDARVGERVAIVGASGCGKSSFLKLLPRLYDVDDGSVRIDGCDVRALELRSLRQALSFVPQEPILFQGTLRQNLRQGNPGASAEEIARAMRIACLVDVVERLPEGLDTVLGPMGAGLSGGEKQRVAIARAVLQDRPILILDEATSALDGRTERRLLARLKKWGKDRIVIVVSHRLAAARWADRVVVFDGGRVVEHGSHASLYRPGTAYFALWEQGGLDAVDAPDLRQTG
jgi:ABC-type multidrug transport system fused ATPase/permease subunit